jgi:hypothetical protein
MTSRASVLTFPRAYANRCPVPASTETSGVVNGGSLHLRGGTLTVKPVLKFANGAFGAEIEGIDWDVAQLDAGLVADVSEERQLARRTSQSATDTSPLCPCLTMMLADQAAEHLRSTHLS